MKSTKRSRENIKLYRAQIEQYTSGSNNIRRLNNMNFIRHCVTSEEPYILFQSSGRKENIDYTYISNINNVYDYLNQFQDKSTKHLIDIDDVKNLHALFTQHTHMESFAGQYRQDDKILNIIVDGARMHTIDASLVPYTMNNIIYKANTSKSNILDRAFDIHYDIVALQPFEDFNKRLARATMNLFLVLNKMPMIFFNNKKEDKLGYVDAIAARANGRNKEYTEYMLRVTERSYREILRNIKHSKII